ncbi:MAG: hypothetical protein JNK34_11125, partial [Tabrizicola sp.]|nr:hypothetical protein [Tabrizicola sp.]
ASIAFSGSASDLTTGTLPAARFNDTAHGNRAGGALHAVATPATDGFMSGADKSKLDAILGTNTGDQTITLTGAVTGSGTGSFATTLANNVVGNGKLTDMATGTIKGRSTAGTGDPEDLTAAQVRSLINVADGANNYSHPNHTGDVTSTGDGATVIAADAVTNAKLADMATARIKGRTTAGAGDPEDLTGTQATALLDVFTSGAKGLVPASGGGTTNFLRADGTFAAPPGGGGGTPGGSTGEVQYNNAGAFAGAADVEIESGQLRLPFISTPATPAASGLKLYGMDFGPGAPAFLLPSGKVKLIQSDLGDFNIQRFVAPPGATSFGGEHSLNLTSIGTASASAVAVTDLHRMTPRVDALVTVAAATAIAGWRSNNANSRFLRVGRDANAPGGFLFRNMWGPATGVSVATHRGFCGLSDMTAAPTDVEPSTRLNVIGMGWDAADANIQIMHNDGAGACTKIDLGASFPVPTVDRANVYEIQLYSPNDLTQSVSYRVIRYNTTAKTIAAEATGTITTNLPAVTAMLGPACTFSVGGTSSIVGAALMGILAAREY